MIMEDTYICQQGIEKFIPYVINGSVVVELRDKIGDSNVVKSEAFSLD